MEAKANAAIAAGRHLLSRHIREAEYHARPELRRTLDVEPPIENGSVRIVQNRNKGKNNKRLCVRLAPPEALE